MQIDRRAFLLSAISAVGCSRQKDTSPLARAAAWLWAQQGEDGGFHSATYGLLRSGQSLTPFALEALLDVPETIFPAPAGGVDRGLAFLLKNTKPDGSLGLMDQTAADYPNYATALAVTVMVKARRPTWQAETAPMLGYLKSQQFSEDNGWKPGDAPYGGWGMGGKIHRPPDAGHVDLSMVRMVVEALHDAGVPASDALMQRAIVYLKRSQNTDGGFYFSTVNLETNKAGEAGGRGASYGTATADGVLALLAAGVPGTDPRVVTAREWLQKHHRPDRAPGFDVAPYTAWGTGLRYYYGGVITRAMAGLPVLLPPQRKDGSFWNSNNLVKENDPIIATTFAVRVLLNQLG